MNDHRSDRLAAAHQLLGQARVLSRDLARRHPETTWIDAYVAIDRAQAQLPDVDEPATSAPTPAPTGTDDARSCSELLQEAQAALARIEAADGPDGLLLARVYLAEAITEVAGRQP